jgi:hypothetical protein
MRQTSRYCEFRDTQDLPIPWVEHRYSKDRVICGTYQYICDEVLYRSGPEKCCHRKVYKSLCDARYLGYLLALSNMCEFRTGVDFGRDLAIVSGTRWMLVKDEVVDDTEVIEANIRAVQIFCTV